MHDITNSIILLLGSSDMGNLAVVKSLITNQSHYYNISRIYDFVNILLLSRGQNIEKLIFLQELKYCLANNGEYLFEMIEECNSEDGGFENSGCELP